MNKMHEYIEDMVIEFLEAHDYDNEPHITTFELKGCWYVAFRLNSKPFIYDFQDIVWNGMHKLEERDNWEKYK